MSRQLDVYLHGILAGIFEQDDSGRYAFTYAPPYLSLGGAALSVTLPLREAAYDNAVARPFFSGLLPDEEKRAQLARYLGVSEENPFALLEIVGGECAGALSFYPTGTTPPSPVSEAVSFLTDDALTAYLQRLPSRPLLAGEDGFRLSLAGAQDKLPVVIKDGQIGLSLGTNPTTHIIKPLINGIPDSAHNELFCMQLATLMGIDVPHTQLRFLNGTPFFIVARYDRTTDATGQITRIHQEDFCQALGIPPQTKYEREGGPSYAQCQTLLARHSAHPAVDQLAFRQRVIFNYLIGNSDAHGKNFSLLYRGKKPILAPAYDLLCTAVYPDLAVNMAMKIGRQYHPDRVLRRYWHALVPDTAAAQRSLEKQLQDMCHACPQNAQLLRQKLETEGITSPLFEQIQAVIQTRSQRILEQLR